MDRDNVIRMQRTATSYVSDTAQTDIESVRAFLREQARSVQDTATRCTDPKVVSELQVISEELLARADALRIRS